MNRYLLIILFTFLYFMAMLRPFAPLIIYYANYDYIVAELCKNRDKPELNCNGTCHLKTMIKKNQEQSKGNPISTVPFNMKDYPISTLGFSHLQLPEHKYFEDKSFLTLAKILIKSEYTFSIFHPPKSLA